MNARPELGPAESRATDFALLLKSYEIERAEDTQAGSLMVGLLTATVGLFSLVGFALVRADAESLPGWLVAVVPLTPLPFMAWGALIAHLSQVRGRLIDGYETELRRRSSGVRVAGLSVPSGHTLAGRIWTSSYGRSVIGIAATAFLAMYIVVIVEAFRYSHRSEPTLAVVTTIVYSIATMAIIGLYVIALSPDRVLRAREKRETETGRGEVFFFQYGSNMLLRRLEKKISEHFERYAPVGARENVALVGPARLPGWRLEFCLYSAGRACRVADVVEGRQEDEVWGALFRLDLELILRSDGKRSVMDRIEGHRPERP